MNSKVSKSEKTKLKFAQSNINHVYRGNTAEPHHKPTVRQYGMQVVGKVQGTRRLPPPAWVPSIKAETGGLDSRVSIVPPGGGGWGAPTESRTTGTGATPEMGSTVDQTPLSSVNGPLSREAIGTSFEPAYTRSLGNKSEASDETSQGPQNDSLQMEGENKANSHGTVTAVSGATPAMAGALSQPAAWTSKNTVASGGLAANKPFFQRPPPVTSSATTASSRIDERKPTPLQAGGGASEIVGEPTGWAAVTEEEPNFDERILFSDEEESQEDSKSTLRGPSSSRVTGQNDSAPHTTAESLILPAKQTIHASGSFVEPEPASHIETSRAFPSTFGAMSSSTYDETSREKASDTWSNSESPSNFGTYTAPTVSRHPTALSFANAPMSAHCGVTTDSEHVLTVGQYMQHSVPSQGINSSGYPVSDPYFSSPVSANHIAGTGGLLDSMLPPTDADTELQNAQRQARTQEFRTAVERARISRQQRETFSTEGEGMLQKSVVNLISEPCDSSHTQPASQPMLLSSGHSVVPPVISGVLPQQLLLSNAYPQGVSQNRSSLAAAAAAATAAAMVCGPGGAPARLSTPRVGPNLVKVPHSQPLSVSPHSAANMIGSWQGPGSLPPNIPTTGFTNPKPPTVPQVLQSALSMATGGASNSHPNGVFLNPDFFVERLLEILNQQQVVRPQSTPQTSVPSRTLIQTTETTTCNQTHERLIPVGRVETPSKSTFGEDQFSDLTELSQQMESVLNTESVVSGQSVVPVVSEQASANSSTGKQQTQNQQQQQVKRVPGLMDVKVPTSTSRNLAYLWEQDDYLSGASGRGSRGRSKGFTEKSRGGSRGRRAGGRFASDDISILRTNSGDRRIALNPRGSHEDYERTPSNRPWHSKTSRRIFNGPKAESDNPLTTSDIHLDTAHSLRAEAKPAYGSEPEEYVERTETFQEETTTSDRRYESSSATFETGSTSRQASGVSKSKVKSVQSNTQESESGSQRRTDYSRQHDRVRRGRGGSGFYYSSSRTFTSEEGSSKYTYPNEQKVYPRVSRGGTSTGGSSTFPTRNHRSGASGAHPDTNSRRRNLDEAPDEAFEHDNRSGHAHGEEYQSQHPQRENRRDREWRSHEPVEEKSFQKSRGHSRALDVRRGSVYRDECHFSDGEPHATDNKRSQNRHYAPSQRNRSHDGQRVNQKGNSRQNAPGQTQEYVFQSTETGERPTQSAQQKSTSYDVPIDEYDDSDLPTVRVPPMDTTFKSARTHYARGHRSATFQRGSGLRRIASNRTSGAQQQQTKRSTGSGVQGSRRYRDLQNRYRDDKDGDGGAAAGGGGSGAGRSNVSGDGTNMCGSGGSGTNGCSDLGENQNGGNSRNQGSSNDSAQDGGVRFPNSHKQNSDSKKCHDIADAESNENNTMSNNREAIRLQRYNSSTSATADGHAHASVAGGRGRKVRATNVSASGGRPSGGHGFRRQSFMRSDHVASSRSTAISSIPPLMSITPEGPFTRSSRDFDSMFNSTTRTANQAESSSEMKTTSSKTSAHQTFPDSSAEDPEDQDFLSDGFTKVVSKSSKKHARRKLQLELSAAVSGSTQKSGIRRSEDGKSVVPQPKIPVIDRSSAHEDRSSHSLSSRSKNQESVSLNAHPHKTKPFPVKPTFMGPPMCLTNGQMQNSPINDNKSGATDSAPVTSENVAFKRHSISVSPPVSTNAQRSSPSNTDIGRTWSKVVGTKAPSSFAAVPKEAGSENPSNEKSDSVWSTKRQTVERHAESSMLTETAVQDMSSKSNNVTESLKPAWSSPASAEDKEAIQKSVQSSAVERTGDSTLSSVGGSANTAATTPSTTTPLANSTTVTNVCKVRPQQQQPSPQVGTSGVLSTVTVTSTSNVTHLSPINSCQEQAPSLNLCSTDLTPIESERLDCNFDVASQSRGANRQVDDVCSSLLSSRPVQAAWSEGLPTPVPGSYFEGRMGSTYDTSFSTSSWPPNDVDPARANSIQPHYGHLSSDGTFNSPPGAPVGTDLPAKGTHPMALGPRHQPYSAQHYNQNPTPSGEAQHFSGIYGSPLNDMNKRSSSNTLNQAPHTAFAPVGGQVYVAPQQPSSNQQSQSAGSFAPSWTVPPNAQPNPLPQGISHGARFRQRVPHLDISPFNGYPFPTEMPNEFAFMPSVTGCVPAAPSGGLYSTIQGQTQTNYHHGSSRSVGSSSGPPWSLLGSSSGSPALQVSGNDYGSGMAPTPLAGASGSGGGGLLPHPVPQGFSNSSAPISSSSSNFMTHPNYVGVIGGGRPSANDLSGTSGRQRSIPQGLYPAHNLTHSPSAQSQQQFQLHSPFYPSLSPSHQRVHLQQFPGAQGRSNIHSFVNPQNNLYTAAYGPSPSQPTPPPLHSQIGYPNSFSTESSVAPPGAFHSNVQSHSFSNLGLQPPHPHVHGHRSLQSSDPQMISRSLSAVNNHGGSALVIPGTVGPSSVSAYPGYPQPTAPAPLSVSGYPLKPILPTP